MNLLHQYTVRLSIIAIFIAGSFLVGVTNSYASEFTANIDIAGGNDVVLGQEVTLEWLVTGGPALCSISNGGGDFEVTSDFEQGTVDVTPPESGDPFVISCRRVGIAGGGTEIVTDNVVVIPRPTIDFRPRTGVSDTQLTRGLSGSVQASLTWNANYANECDDITFERASLPGTMRTPQRWQYQPDSSQFTTSGRLDIGISETTTFYITCTNTALGLEETEAVTMVVVDPPEPAPMFIDVIKPTEDPTQVSRDPVRQYGVARFEFVARNASYCVDYKAYNLHEYPSVETALPEGYSSQSYNTDRYMNIRLGTSTILTVTCGRPAVTVGSITYPATSTTLVRQFNLDELVEIEIVPGEDPSPSASITISPETVERNAISGNAFISTSFTAANVDYCNLYAYRTYDGEEYDLSGWTRDAWWQRVWSDSEQNLSRSLPVAVATSTQLRMRCVNIYDFNFGDEAAREAAIVNVFATSTVVAPPGAPIPPTTWLYSGPSFRMTAEEIWDERTNEVNMMEEYVHNYLNRIHIRPDLTWGAGNIMENVTGEISFIFNHPHGAGQSSVYNIHMRYCDEADGMGTYTLSSDGSGEIGTIVGDMSYPGHHDDCNTLTEEVSLLAEGVVLTDGEEITLTCTADQGTPGVRGGEGCRVSDLYFGTGSGNRVLSVPEDPAAPENTLIWMSEGATRCDGMVAESDGVPDYTWSNSRATYGVVINTPTSPITTYNVTCERPFLNVATSEDVEVITSNDPELLLFGEETVSDIVEYEVGACWDVAPEPDVLLPNAPTNQVVAPAGLESVPDIFVTRSNECVPLVDLSVSPVYRGTNLATDSVIDVADGVDNVNGTFNLSIVPYVQNLSNIDLPADASISYVVTLSGDGIDETNSGTYDGALPANTPANTYQLTDQRYDGIRFGTYNAEISFNLTGLPNYPDSNFGNNNFTDSVVLPVPEPHMTAILSDGRPAIENSRTNVEAPLVRSGTVTDLTWSVNVNYPMDCTLTGPGIGSMDLVLANVGSNDLGLNPSTGTVPVALQSSGEFVFECTEPSTGTTFTQNGLIEVVPNFEEF